MIIDSLLFSHEIEILKLRLDIMYNYIDYFIIVESRKTFRNKEKKLFFATNKNIFEKYLKKIIYLVIDNFPIHNKNDEKSFWNNLNWKNRCYQSNYILNGINKIIEENNLKKQNLNKIKIIFSDCDEIINPNVLKNISSLDFYKNKINKFEMDFYVYNIFTKGEKKWYGALITTLENMIELINKGERYLESARRNHAVPHIEKGGWHFTYFGNIYTQIRKINSIADVFVVSEKELLSRINNYQDPLGREGHKTIKFKSGPHFVSKNICNYNDYPDEIICYQYNINNELSKIAFKYKSKNEIFFRLTKFYYKLFNNLKNEYLFILTYRDKDFFNTLKDYFVNSNIRKFHIDNCKDYIWDIAFIDDIKIKKYINYKILVIESEIKLDEIEFNYYFETEDFPIFEDNLEILNDYITNKNINKKYIYVLENKF